MGIGYIIVSDKDNADSIIGDLKEQGETVYTIGEIKKGDKTVKMV
jgi:phosphoribosylaminoimidazole (AIR) synthetase